MSEVDRTVRLGNHHAIAHEAQLETREYRYYKAETRGLDIEGMLEDLQVGIRVFEGDGTFRSC